jgi:hypothetical protein
VSGGVPGDGRDRPEPGRDRSREMTAEALRFKWSRLDPIRVFLKRGTWLVEYGSYARGRHSTRAAAVAEAARAAVAEDRGLVIGGPFDDTASLLD